MKIRLPRLPLWLRSPCGYARTQRRLKTDWAAPVRRDAARRAELSAYRRADFLQDGGTYLPPDATPPRKPRRWRFWTDPIIVGSLLTIGIMAAALAIFGSP